jgi:hypothetical protein
VAAGVDGQEGTLLAVVVALTIDTRTARWGVDNARSYRPTKHPALPTVHLGHWPCQVVHVPLPSIP